MQPKHLYLTLAFSLVSAALAAAPFEGLASYKTLDKASHNMDFAIKGDKVRVEMNNEGRQGIMIMDSKLKQMLILMPERNSYMVMKMDGKNAPKGKKSGKLVKTGNTETILGYKAEEWAVEGGDKKSSFWGTTELGTWNLAAGNRGSGPEMDLPAELKDKGFFPLRMVGERGGMEATKIEKKSLPDSLFEVPSGYEAMQMGAPMGGLKPSQQKAMMERMKKMTPEEREKIEKMMQRK